MNFGVLVTYVPFYGGLQERRSRFGHKTKGSEALKDSNLRSKKMESLRVSQRNKLFLDL